MVLGLQKSHRSLSSLVLPAVAVACIIAFARCTPQNKSYWNGTYTKLPEPPLDSRLQIGTATESDGKLFINYVVWDRKENIFKRLDVHYTTTLTAPGTLTEAGGYEQGIYDGEVLVSGAIVDQKKGVIILPGGQLLDGKTGDILDNQGAVLKQVRR